MGNPIFRPFYFYYRRLGVQCTRHYGSYKPGKLRGTRQKGRKIAVKSSQLGWEEQYRKCVQYNIKFTPVYTV